MPPSFASETGLAPSNRVMRVRHTGGIANTTFDEVVGTSPFTGTVSLVQFIPDAAMTGATATERTLKVLNKTQTLVPALLSFITGTDLVAFVAKTLTAGVAAQLAVNAGDILSFASTITSTGTAHPSGTIEVTITRNDIL